jgi:DnaJ-class molecular chaperone
MDYYTTLGIPKGSSDEEIKRAYRKLAMQHHPDRGGDAAKFQQIQEAYNTLGDAEKRQQYDNPQPQGFNFHFSHPGGPGFNDLDEILRQFGHGFPGGGGDPFGRFRQNHAPRRNKDLRVQITVDLASTLKENHKTISVQTSGGSRHTVDVAIPRGVQNGSTIKYSGLGDNLFESLPRGDLYVVIIVQHDPRFGIQDFDLIYNADINCFDAILGQTIEIPGLDDRQFSLAIPAGCQPGTVLRIPNQGLYALGTAHRGHLLIQINVNIPTNLTEAQLDMVRRIQVGL